MIGYENTSDYDTSLRAFHYLPNRTVTEIEPAISDIEAGAMNYAFELADEALKNGNPPVGAVLIVNNGEHNFGGITHDKTSRKLNGHGEIVAYEDAQKVVGDNLSGSTLVSTAVLCSSCTPPYAEGKIGKIITAAPRRFVYPLTGIMRPREINMHELLGDGETDTISVINYELERSLGMFATYGKLRDHRVPEDINDFLRPFVEAAYIT